MAKGVPVIGERCSNAGPRSARLAGIFRNSKPSTASPLAAPSWRAVVSCPAAPACWRQKFRFDKVKIDRSFVRNLGVDHYAAAIVRAVVGLCDALGMSTIAEGVENDEQLAILRAQGCREAQGFLYWAPMPARALHRVIERQREVA